MSFDEYIEKQIEDAICIGSRIQEIELLKSLTADGDKMKHHDLVQLYGQKLAELQLWAQTQGMSCKNCKHGDNAMTSAPCESCWMCTSFTPSPEWLEEECGENKDEQR
ncbi:MAG: hypothetical protein MJZ34_02655 [Paludibacteraceae bacterium]|nr:hypothetical protein [Paludibacteraceae bacterium]